MTITIFPTQNFFVYTEQVYRLQNIYGLVLMQPASPIIPLPIPCPKPL